jgi:tetratricopeptide (TPR) repeat protein
VVQIRWTAYDAHFGPRPITLEYRPMLEVWWRTIARAVANEERYEWEVPPKVVGEVAVRLTARDAAGNVATAAFSPVEILPIEAAEPAPEKVEAVTEPAPPAAAESGVPEPEESLASEERARRVEALLAQARWHLDRGEWPLARSRLSELLAASPHDAPGLKALAEVEYRTGEYGDALRAYHDVLRWHPEDTEALHGRALAEVALGDYSGAASSLRQILKLKPGDPETQLHLGDVLLMMGQRGEARESWQRVGQAVGSDREMAGKAARRLELYPPSNR